MIHTLTPAGEAQCFWVECSRCLKASRRTLWADGAGGAVDVATAEGFVCRFVVWFCGRCDREIQGAT